MADGLARLAVLLVPEACAPMQMGDSIGLLLPQTRLQHIGEKVMIAIPLALIVQWNDKQVLSFHTFQHRPAIGSRRNRIAQGPAQPVEDGGLQQEIKYVFGLA